MKLKILFISLFALSGLFCDSAFAGPTKCRTEKTENLERHYCTQGGSPEYLARQSELQHEKRHGLTTRYYPSGQIKEEIPYQNGKRHGTFKTYYEDGQLSAEQEYKNGEEAGPFHSKARMMTPEEIEKYFGKK